MPVLKLPVNAADHHLGNDKAFVTLVEYGDFECPYCRRAHPLVKRLLKERGEDIRFIFRNFPLRKIHPHAHMAAIAAEAAGKQGRFWEMHDLIFENQNKLTRDFLWKLAEDIGLDIAVFAKDSKSNEILTKIEKDFTSGLRSGVNGTPSFFLNGSFLSTYNETYESLLDAVLLEYET